MLLTIWAFRLLHWTTYMRLTTSLLGPNSICSFANILLAFRWIQSSVQFCQVGPEAVKRLIDSIWLQTATQTTEVNRTDGYQMRKTDRLCDDLTNCRRDCLLQMILFPPLYKTYTGWKRAIDHSLHESLKTPNLGKQSKVTVSPSHPGSFQTPVLLSLFWKALPPKLLLLPGKYKTIPAAPQQHALTSAGAFLPANASLTAFQVD